MGLIKLQPDPGASLTYQAEDVWMAVCRDYNIAFENFEEALEFANTQIVNKDWWTKSINRPCFSYRPLKVRDMPKSYDVNTDEYVVLGAYFDTGVICLNPKAGLNLFTLTHEIVHYMGYRDHDNSFRFAHLEIIKNVCSRNVYKELKSWYKVYGIRERKTHDR